MDHILSSCTTSLIQGRYRWRHDSVLQELADKLERERTKKRTRHKPRIISVCEGGTEGAQTKCILDESGKWEMTVDLKQKTCVLDNFGALHCYLVRQRQVHGYV